MPELKIRSKGMLGTQHSWAVTMRNILTQFQNQGHKLYLASINGETLIPPHLKSRLNREIKIPDLDICYTIPKNFEERFEKKSKLKLAIYNYETSKLPKMWFNTIKHVDYVLPSSQFSKEVFVNSGWPESKCIVIPHGINPTDFSGQEVFKLQTTKSFKFLNISIPHRRKNLDLLIDAYYSTFSNQDDVCLVLKSNFDKPKYTFEVDLEKILIEKQQKYLHRIGGLPQIEVVQDRLDNMAALYRSCDVLISASSSEGFGLPFLEALACQRVVIAPRCTGQLDFLHDQNSLLVDVDEIPAPSELQYWTPSNGATTYLPKFEALTAAMSTVYQNFDYYHKLHQNSSVLTVQKFTWENAAKKILELT